jgi:TATA-binding protein-associated factor Taf7
MDDMKAMKTALANIKKLARDSLVQRYKSKQKPAEDLPLDSMEAESDMLEEEMTEDMGEDCEDVESGDENMVEIIAMGGRKPTPKREFEEEAPMPPKNRGRFQKKLK